MGGLFSKPELPPPPAPPPPLPTVVEEEEGAVKRARRRKGYEQTFLTGGLTPRPTGKKGVLG